MQFQRLHRDILQLVSGNVLNWPVVPGEQAFISYFRFDDQAIATAYGKSLIACRWAKEFELRKAKWFESGYELKIKGLSQIELEILVREFESKDWINGLFDAQGLEAQYQLHCDRRDLEADYYDSAWA